MEIKSHLHNYLLQLKDVLTIRNDGGDKHGTQKSRSNGNRDVRCRSKKNSVGVPKANIIEERAAPPIRVKAKLRNGSSKASKLLGVAAQGKSEDNSIVQETDQFNSKNATLESSLDDLFPKSTPWLIVLMTLVFRLWYVSKTENWWILHPDEVYQTIEVAHSEVYGYGFRTYEYLPAEHPRYHMTTARAQEVALGMYSLRSFMLPHLIALFMIVVDKAGIAVPPFLAAKIFHVIVTSFLPLSVYHFTKTIYQSHSTASLAAILTSTSHLINVLGTHTLVNSFLSPFVFLSLTVFINIVNKSSRRLKEEEDSTVNDNLVARKPDLVSCEKHSRRPNCMDASMQSGVQFCHSLSEENSVRDDMIHKEHNYNRDMNANVSDFNDLNKSHQYRTDGHQCRTNRHQCRTNRHQCRTDGHQCQTDNIKHRHIKDELNIKRRIGIYLDVDDVTFRFDLYEYIYGLCLSLCVYTRCDVILLPLFIGISYSRFSCHKIVRILVFLHMYLLGFLTGLLIGGFYDYLCYGTWFISPYQWLNLNVLHNTSNLLFGVEPFTFYLKNILFVDMTHVILTAIMSLNFLFSRYVLPFNGRTFLETSRYNLKCNVDKHRSAPMLTFLFLLLIYSLSGHKEVRFFHNGVVFMYTYSSYAILRMLRITIQLTNQNVKVFYQYCFTYSFYLFIGLLASSQLSSFLQLRGDAISRWTYAGNDVSHQTNTCLDYIRQQDDVTGVFLDQPIYMTGGYTVLHKDVPILSLNFHEFFEFNRKSRLEIVNIVNQNISLSVFGQISNFISIYNTHYLWKQLILQPEYNYLVLRTERQFTDTGYTEIFRSGKSKVMKRQDTNETATELLNVASKAPLGYNATVLEYEGYWLIRYGLYKLAETKLLFANRLDNSRIGPYQLLIGLFQRFKQNVLIQNVLDACVTLHKEVDCLGVYNPIRLQDVYSSELLSFYDNGV